MQLFVVGLNFRKTPVGLREQFSVPAERIGAVLSQLRAASGLQEAVVLSTCNRVEVYAVTNQRSIQPKMIFQSVAQVCSATGSIADFEPVEAHAYVHRGDACVHHLFRVASSLDSLVVGETEIVGQVKKAYQIAQACGATGKLLNRLFQTALSVSKHVRSRSGIGRCSTSVGAVALDVAEKIFGDNFVRQTVLVIGAGKMSETTLRHLSKRGARRILIANRSVERAQELAAQFNGDVVLLTDLAEALNRADLVISSTSAPHYLLIRQEMEAVMKKRAHRSLLFIDLAVPRDIDPGVQELEGVYLYNIDQLADLARQNLQQRQAEAALCEKLISEEAEKLVRRLSPTRLPHAVAETIAELLSQRPRTCPCSHPGWIQQLQLRVFPS
ncbi:MAG: glutamyl-tRNA reductase [Verrucomicrobia bacterium]|nr:glutamyl-tRNA reductase [Verrucomicrobiota bacterium]